MLRRSFLGLMLAAGALAAPLRADEPTPTFTVHVASVTDLVAKFEYVAGLVDQKDSAGQVVGLLRALNDPAKGIEGFDPSRPVGLYGVVTPQVADSYAVLVVPIKDSEAVLALLRGKLNLEPKKGDEGVYDVQVKGVPLPLHFAFAHKSVYITARTPSALQSDNLLTPEKLHDDAPEGVFGLRFHLDRIPDEVKKIVLGQLELRTEEARAKAADAADPNERVAQEIGAALTRDAFRGLLKDGGALTLRFDVETKDENILAELELDPKPDTPLAKALAGVGQRTSKFAGLAGDDSVGGASLRFVLPKKTSELLAPTWDGLYQKALADAPEAKRADVEPLLKVIFDTLKSGDFDLAFSVNAGDDDTIQGVAGAKVVGGNRAVKALKKVYASDPPKDATMKFAVGEANGVTLHELTTSDEKYAKATGGDKLWLGTSDTLLLAGVEPGAKSLKAAAAAEAAPAPLAAFDFQLAEILRLVDGDLPKAATAEIVQKVYGGDPDGGDSVSGSIEAGETLTARIDIHAKLLAFFTAYDKAKKAKEAD